MYNVEEFDITGGSGNDIFDKPMVQLGSASRVAQVTISFLLTLSQPERLVAAPGLTS